MSGILLALLAAAVSGVLMAVQGALNSALGKIIGLLETTLWVHLTATVVVAILVFAFKFGNGNFARISEAPWYFFLGGVLGVVITYGVVSSIPRVGVAVATTAIIVGQVSTALFIDHMGLFDLEKIPFTWVKFVGAALLAMGARLMLN